MRCSAGMSPEPTPPWKLHLRGVLVGLHVLAVVVLSSPDLSGGMNRKAWDAPMVEAEFAAWAERFDMGTDELQDRAWTVAVSWVEARDTLLTPFEPYHEYLGVRQRWRMFAAPNRVPARIAIAVEIDGEWRLIYEARSPEHTWRADTLHRERLRVPINLAAWRHNRGLYKKLIEWIADRAAEDFPEASRVRVFYLRAKTPTAKELRAGMRAQDEEIHVAIRELEARR